MAKPDKNDGGTVRRHLLVGWCGLLLFLCLGLVLEALHAFKVGWLLDVDQEARRLTWRLAHAHGTLLSLVNVAFALTLQHLREGAADWVKLPSRLLIAATALLPGGFFLGGLFVHGGDPGPGILAVPVGGLLLLVAVASTARGVLRSRAG